MPLSPAPTRARKPARARRGPLILAELAAGASLDGIADARELSLKRVEMPPSDELQRRRVSPARDYAWLQIARRETMSGKLFAEAKEADLPSIDRPPRILDRLDTCHGFSEKAPSEDYAAIPERLMAKMNIEVGELPPPAEDNP